MIGFTRWSALALLVPVMLVVAPWPGAARPVDVAGWQAARWGMDEAALERAFGNALGRLPGRREYGGAYATRYLADVALGQARFRAILQMNVGDDRLQQVLLEPLERARPEEPFRAARDALREMYGPPDGSCGSPRTDGSPHAVELWWRFATTTVRLAFFDFYAPGILYEDKTIYLDPEDEARRIRGANPRFLPRRTLVRYHPTARADLASPACAADVR